MEEELDEEVENRPSRITELRRQEHRLRAGTEQIGRQWLRGTLMHLA
jgi:hypothetical protein